MCPAINDLQRRRGKFPICEIYRNGTASALAGAKARPTSCENNRIRQILHADEADRQATDNRESGHGELRFAGLPGTTAFVAGHDVVLSFRTVHGSKGPPEKPHVGRLRPGGTG